MLVVAEPGEGGVVARPVEDAGHRGDDDQRVEHRADTADLGEERILRGGENGAGDQRLSEAEARGEDEHERANDEANRLHRAEGEQRKRDREPALEQIDHIEGAAALERGGIDDGMQAEQIDGAVGKEGHGSPAKMRVSVRSSRRDSSSSGADRMGLRCGDGVRLWFDR